MNRFYCMLQEVESPLFLHVNRRWNCGLLSRLFYVLTLLGGASFSLTFSLAAGLVAPQPWNIVGWQGLAAVAVSHIPVAIAKRSMPRLRPHQVFPFVNTQRRPLQDSSFPSGHTTAAFAMMTPWMHALPAFVPILLPIAVGVGLSRIYFGLHFPSDCVAGALLGSSIALLLTHWIV
ncbi:phosphatase PAP2 family protein [Gorillibacterium massiliense]|uniref:phosphatase PAP2 family protein n=1 Tax=Gorillibacterium massiliense TaxID=1280390 RepID=UPI0004B14B0F|nr:phosphatase PAP2 family protein [Gorillibacterium massiliense]